MGTLPMFCIEKPFCACTAQRNLRIAWCLQNRILVSVKIKLQAITSGNDNNILVHSYHTENVKTVLKVSKCHSDSVGYFDTEKTAQ